MKTLFLILFTACMLLTSVAQANDDNDLHCAALVNALREIVKDRVAGVSKEDELKQLESANMLPAGRVIYRTLINDVYALPERKVQMYPSVFFSQCLSGMR
jgi:hypothetical protein